MLLKKDVNKNYYFKKKIDFIFFYNKKAFLKNNHNGTNKQFK